MFNSTLELAVYGTNLRLLGTTPADQPIPIPRGQLRAVGPLKAAKELDWEALAAEVRREKIPGLVVPPDTRSGHLLHIKELRNLRTLVLTEAKVTDEGLSHLRALTNLRVLDLNDTKITDEGLSQLSGLEKLRKLYLGGTSVTGAGLRHLKALHNLRVLGLTGSNITDEGLNYLSDMGACGSFTSGERRPPTRGWSASRPWRTCGF